VPSVPHRLKARGPLGWSPTRARPIARSFTPLNVSYGLPREIVSSSRRNSLSPWPNVPMSNAPTRNHSAPMEVPFDEIFPNSSAPVHVDLPQSMPNVPLPPSFPGGGGPGWPPGGGFPSGGGPGGGGPGWPPSGGGPGGSGPGWPPSGPGWPSGGGGQGWPPGGGGPGGGGPGWPPGGGGPGWPPSGGGPGGPGGPSGSGGQGISPPYPPHMGTFPQSGDALQGIVSELLPKLDVMKLNDNNWVAWSRYAHAILLSAGVEWCIQADYGEYAQDWVAQTLLTGSLSDAYQVEVSDQKSAHGIWTCLLNIFTVRGRGRILALFQELHSLKMTPNEKPSVYITRARKLVMSLRSFGHYYTDLALCYVILAGLSPEYEQDKHTQMNLIQDNPDLGRLQGNLELTYIRLQAEKVAKQGSKTINSETPKPFHRNTQGSRPMIARTPSSLHSMETNAKADTVVVKEAVQGGRTAVQQQRRVPPVCFICGEEGHIKPHCPRNKEQATHCIETNEFGETPPIPGWLVDSGATDHISPDKHGMEDYVSYNDTQFVTVAKGVKDSILGEGTVTVHLDNGSKRREHV
jgi:hypothetical protein